LKYELSDKTLNRYLIYFLSLACRGFLKIDAGIYILLPEAQGEYLPQPGLLMVNRQSKISRIIGRIAGKNS
jgi:hypothetical protein